LAALPMASEALAMLRVPGVLPALQLFGRAAGTVLGSTKFGRDLPGFVRVVSRLQNPAALSAFSRTLRAVVDGRGQLVTGLDRSYLMQSVPVQLIWGEDDSVIPVSHARTAHAALPDSHLEIFKDSGHTPFHDHPDRFIEIVEQFIDSTEPAEYDEDLQRSLLKTGIRQYADSEPVETASRSA
jgi:pimeloyl-ACP methyl ester carboxylesterase